MATRTYMLPGSLFQDPGTEKRTLRDWLVDILMFLLALGIGIAVIADGAKQHGDVTWVIEVICGPIALLALWWRRSHPVAVGVIAISLGAVSGLAAGAGTAALFNLAVRGSRRALLWSVVLATVATAIYPLIYAQPDFPYVWQLVVGTAATVFVIGWGLFARAQRDLVRTLRERTVALEAEQARGVEAAREAERRRIASEMHDVLAHRISLLSVHAGALEFHPEAPPQEIAAAAGVIRATAHDALRDLREVIGVLRAGDGGADPPQPTLDAIPALIDESRAAGMQVRARLEAEGGEPLVGRTAYRIVQEGLTNARKHAPAAAVEVTVEAEEELLVLVVSRRAAATANGGPPGGGTGLIGLSERVVLAGGELHHGPNERGDFVLRATLPWT